LEQKPDKRPSTARKLGLNVPSEVADKLKELSEATLIPQSKLLRRALELLFESYAPDKQKTRK
jgi:predicted DNA-binding protein